MRYIKAESTGNELDFRGNACSVMYGYIWRYKNCSVMVDYGRIASATIYQNNELDMNIETIRAYVKGELYRLISKEVKNNAM